MVSGFRRKLQPGEEPSEMSIQSANEAGVRLKDNTGKFIYTFVRTHPRGSTVGKEIHDVKKRWISLINAQQKRGLQLAILFFLIH